VSEEGRHTVSAYFLHALTADFLQQLVEFARLSVGQMKRIIFDTIHGKLQLGILPVTLRRP
jgi:hypothetical protein